jgi:hypothetical protein
MVPVAEQDRPEWFGHISMLPSRNIQMDKTSKARIAPREKMQETQWLFILYATCALFSRQNSAVYSASDGSFAQE